MANTLQAKLEKWSGLWFDFVQNAPGSDEFYTKFFDANFIYCPSETQPMKGVAAAKRWVANAWATSAGQSAVETKWKLRNFENHGPVITTVYDVDFHTREDGGFVGAYWLQFTVRADGKDNFVILSDAWSSRIPFSDVRDIHAYVEEVNAIMPTRGEPGSAEKMAACFSPDAILMPEGSPTVVGNAAILEFYGASWPKREIMGKTYAELTRSYRLLLQSVEKSGDDYICVFKSGAKLPDGTVMATKSLFVMKRIEGKFLCTYVLYNIDTAH